MESDTKKFSIVGMLRSAWAHARVWASAAKSKIDTFKMSLTVTGWQIVVVSLVSAVVVLSAYWTGRLHDIAHGARSYAVSLLQPEPEAKMMPLALPRAPKPQDPDVQLVAANAALEIRLEQMGKIADAWKKQADDKQVKIDKLKAARPAPKVRYVRVKEKTFLCDVAGVCE